MIQVHSIPPEKAPLVTHPGSHEVQVPLLDMDEVAQRLVALRVEMPDDEVSVHDVDDQDASGADQLSVLLEDSDVRLFIVIPEGGPEVEGRVEWPFGHGDRFREPAEVSDAIRRAIGHALLARCWCRAWTAQG